MINTYNPYNPYYNNYNYMQPQNMRMEQQTYKPQIGLQGKPVDTLDVVRVAEFPYDGSVSYFPLTDGSAIATKQLQSDGTSKIVIYKPVENTDESQNNTTKYVTEDELSTAINSIKIPDLKDIKEDIKNLKRQIRNLSEDLKEE